MQRNLLLATTACVSAGVLATPAFAQSAPDRGPSSVVEELVVTARKREETLQSVPVAITAVAGSTLRDRGIDSLDQMEKLVPGSNGSSAYNSQQLNLTIRGVGIANVFNANEQSPVGVYWDEVYQTSRASPGLQMFDLERLEVLRGPQGTLFGRNTTGGAVSVISAKPALDGHAHGYATAGYGNYDLKTIEAATDFTLIPDKLGVRIAAQRELDDGYIKNVNPRGGAVGGKDFASRNIAQGRILIRFRPNEDWDINAKAYSNHDIPTIVVGRSYGIPPTNADIFGFNSFTLGDYETSTNAAAYYKTTAVGTGLNIKWTNGPFTITNITAYDDSSAKSQADSDTADEDLVQSEVIIHAHQFTQDFRVGYASGPLNVIAGLFYSKDYFKYDSYVSFLGALGCNGGGGVCLRNRFNESRDSKAIYGEANYELTDRLTLTGGLRYTKDGVKLSDLQSVLLASYRGAPIAQTIPASPTFDPNDELNPPKEHTNGVTGRVILDYELNDDAMVYASVSRGYRSGEWNGSQFFSANEVNFVPPETAWVYETGIKAAMFERRFVVNVAAFYTDLSGQQVITNVIIANASVPNLASISGRVYGLEIESTAAVLDNLKLIASLTLQSSRYDGGQDIAGTPIGGNKFPFTPGTAALLGFEWRMWEQGDSSLTLSANANYTGHYWYDPQNGEGYTGLPEVRGSPSRWLYDARLAYTWKNYTLSAWGKNLSDKYYLPWASSAEGLGFDYTIRGVPRTYGVELNVKF